MNVQSFLPHPLFFFFISYLSSTLLIPDGEGDHEFLLLSLVLKVWIDISIILYGTAQCQQKSLALPSNRRVVVSVHADTWVAPASPLCGTYWHAQDWAASIFKLLLTALLSWIVNSS